MHSAGILHTRVAILFSPKWTRDLFNLNSFTSDNLSTPTDGSVMNKPRTSQRYNRQCYHLYSMHCPARRYQPAFITSEPTTTPHHRTTIYLSEPIGSRGVVAKGRYCHVGKDIADAAAIIAPFTILKRRRKNNHISAPTRPTTTVPQPTTETMERETKLVADVSDLVQRRLLLK